MLLRHFLEQYLVSGAKRTVEEVMSVGVVKAFFVPGATVAHAVFTMLLRVASGRCPNWR